MWQSPASTNSSVAGIPRYAVFGSPIAHSQSPLIHRRFAEQCGIALEYTAIEVAAGRLEAALTTFWEAGGSGANITLPHKLEAVSACVELSQRARRAGVVNTLKRVATGWFGDNTDGSGLVADLSERLRLDLRGRHVLILGAGGAAQGVAPAILEAGVEAITIANRTPERADHLSDWLGEPARVHTVYWQDLKDVGAFDLIINATSAGHSAPSMDLPFGIVAPRTLAYDLSYGAAAVGFLSWAKAAHCAQALDGLGMLVEQAADSFALWHGERPQTDPVYAELRAAPPA